MQVALEDVKEVADFFTIVHHIPGRIRIRAKVSALPAAKKWAQHTPLRSLLADSLGNTQDIVIALLKRIPAIQDVKVNAIIGSATIMYDKNLFDPSLWESWVKKEHLEQIQAKINEFS